LIAFAEMFRSIAVLSFAVVASAGALRAEAH